MISNENKERRKTDSHLAILRHNSLKNLNYPSIHDNSFILKILPILKILHLLLHPDHTTGQFFFQNFSIVAELNMEHQYKKKPTQ